MGDGIYKNLEGAWRVRKSQPPGSPLHLNAGNPTAQSCFACKATTMYMFCILFTVIQLCAVHGKSLAFGGRPPLWTPLVEESQPSGLSGPHAHAPCRLKVSLSLKLRCRAPQLPPAVLLGQKIGQGRKLVKKIEILKVLRMGLSIVENISGIQVSFSCLSRSPQLHFGQKIKIRILPRTHVKNGIKGTLTHQDVLVTPL